MFSSISNYIIHVTCRINDVVEECWLNVPTLAKIFTLAPDLAISLLYTSYLRTHFVTITWLHLLYIHAYMNYFNHKTFITPLHFLEMLDFIHN